MTRLLVSVRSLDEATDAFEAGADLIDLKEPEAGSLGPVPRVVAAEVAKRLSPQVLISMALGELVDVDGKAKRASPPADSRFSDIPAGVSFAKLGLAGCAATRDWSRRWGAALGRLPASCAPVAVIYADWQTARAPAPETVLANAISLGCGAMLIDTFSKKGGGLFDHLRPRQTEELLDHARAQGLVTVLAGSLSLRTAPGALRMQPDYLAVRGAVCDGSRLARLVPTKVRQWQALLRCSAAAS